MYLRLPQTFVAIYGSFTLGLYVAILGPTLMDLIDMLHINNNIMSFTLAFGSLAYAVGGLLSGVLFNYVNRQILISVYYLMFGLTNLYTPHISSYMIFTVITIFKMMCAGGTDCAQNVWVLEMWPGRDEWLQALHFSFAVGCACGPIIAEPFLSVEYKDTEVPFDKLAGAAGSAFIGGSDHLAGAGLESRIYIPYSLSGCASIVTSFLVVYFYWRVSSHNQQQAAEQRSRDKARALASGDQILMLTGLESAGSGCCEPAPAAPPPPPEEEPKHPNPLTETSVFLKPPTTSDTPQALQPPPQPSSELQQVLVATKEHEPPVKITSRAPEGASQTPYYVMVAIALAALCLSFYCGIEITSMNYLATFAVNTDLQLTKSSAAYMSSALTISFAVGRGMGIFVATFTKPHVLFYMCCLVMAAGNLAMLVFANTAENLLWVSVVLFGIGCGPMFPAIVSFYDARITKVTNTVSGIFIAGSMFNVALNSLIIGPRIIEYALILIVCNLLGSVLLLILFSTLHLLTRLKRNQRVKKYETRRRSEAAALTTGATPQPTTSHQQPQQQSEVAASPPSIDN